MQQRHAYALLQVFRGGAIDYDRVALDGTRSTVVHDPSRRINLLPAPDGAALAQITFPECDVAPEGPLPEARTEVRMLTSRGAPKGAPQGMTARCFSTAFTFRPDGMLVLSDGTRALAFAADGGAPMPTAIPKCFTPATSSSWVDASGRVVSAVEERIEITVQDPALAFGCQ